MKRPSFAATLAILLFLAAAQAQETNSYPKARLELFEETTGAVLVRGTDDIGAVEGKNGGVVVKCRETRNVVTNQREFGVIVTVTEHAGLEDTTVVDYDELDALIRAIDYLGKVDWSITSLSHFEVGYTTRSGFKVASYSSRRSGLIEAIAMSNRHVRSRSFMTMVQLGQLRVFLEQAKAKIEVIMKEK